MEEETASFIAVTSPDTGSTVQSEIEALAEAIRYHRRLYYNQEPELSDEAFDALESRLRSLAPNHPVLNEVGAPPEADTPQDEPTETQDLSASEIDRVAKILIDATKEAFDGRAMLPRLYREHYLSLMTAAPNHSAFSRTVPARGLEWPKVAHEIPMGSLNKVNSEQELREWALRCDTLAEAAELPPISNDLSLTEKLDGISIEVLYDNGRIEAAITRGDGTIGERITPNVAQMKAIPATIGHVGRVSVRGEIILRKSDVDAYEELKRKADPKFDKVKSLRNTASGVARTKLHELLPATRFLTILCFDVEGVEGLNTESAKLEFLTMQGFTCPYSTTGSINDLLEVYEAYEKTHRKSLDYEIDGLVVRANNLRTGDLLGELNNRPRAAVAFKFSNEMEVSVVRAIEWNTGDTGRITPVARVDPVLLAGAEVKQASLHNLGLVRELGIAIGDQVLISRRNDVIPYVEKVIVRGGGDVEGPTHCTICHTEVTVDGEYLICPNLQCPARLRGRVKTWLKHLGVLEWGEKTIERFFDDNLIREPADLYRLKVDDIAQLHGFGEGSAKKLIQPLQDNKAIPFPIFVAALGIPAVSKETAKLLAQAGYSTVSDILAAGRDALAELEGLGLIKADKIIAGLEARLPEIERLNAVGVHSVSTDDSGPLAGLSFCFSGSHQRPRKAFIRIVETQGGTVSSSVKKGLNYLVLADANSTSSKAQKARKLGTDIVDEQGFEQIIVDKGAKLDV